jgi:hypothetical protein
LATTLALAFGPGTSADAAEAPSCTSFGSDVYQAVRPDTGANLLTRSKTEIDKAVTGYGFTDDRGVIASAAKSPGAGLTAIWRLYKKGDFVYAADGADADGFEAEGYARQGINFYAATEPAASCLSPIFRLGRGTVHRMATAAEADTLVAAGWSRDAAAFYAVVGNQQAPQLPAPPAPADPGDDGGTRTDTSFSIAVIPDTQNEVTRAADTRFSNRAAYLVDNKSALDLRYMVQVGDLVNWGNVASAQFDKVSAELEPLEAAIPWSGAIGNHDTGAVCAGGSACPGGLTHSTVRDTSGYNRAFPTSRFPQLQGTFAANRIDNAYQTFRAGEVNWLVLNLELWPRPAVVTWAQDVVESHPNHNVIVVTHSYLEADGSIGTNNGGYGDTTPKYLFDHLIKAYPNIKMVLSGHVGDSAVRTDTGTAGNKIVSLLQCFHSQTNPVRIVKIDTAAGSVTSSVYSPQTKTSYPEFATSTSGITFIP